MATRDAARLADRFTAVPQNPGMRIFPTDRKRFVDLQILTGLHTSPAQDALSDHTDRKGSFVDFVGLFRKGMLWCSTFISAVVL